MTPGVCFLGLSPPSGVPEVRLSRFLYLTLNIWGGREERKDAGTRRRGIRSTIASCRFILRADTGVASKTASYRLAANSHGGMTPGVWQASFHLPARQVKVANCNPRIPFSWGKMDQLNREIMRSRDGPRWRFAATGWTPLHLRRVHFAPAAADPAAAAAAAAPQVQNVLRKYAAQPKPGAVYARTRATPVQPSTAAPAASSGESARAADVIAGLMAWPEPASAAAQQALPPAPATAVTLYTAGHTKMACLYPDVPRWQDIEPSDEERRQGGC